MSHYSVAVFHKKDQIVAELMAPYSGYIEVEPYIWLNKEGAIAYAKKGRKDAKGKTDEECWRMIAKDEITDKDGNIYTTENPDSKWDWWEIGGRWSDILTLKNGEYATSGRVGDISFAFDQKEYQRALRFWDVVVDHKPAMPGEKYDNIYRLEYLRRRYLDRETYAMERAQFATYAVITPDGKWHSYEGVGWFRSSREDVKKARYWYAHYRERFIDTADKDWILTICDCHF